MDGVELSESGGANDGAARECAAGNMARIRQEVEAAFQAARQRTAQRLHGKHAETFSQSREGARDRLRNARAKARDLLKIAPVAIPAAAAPTPAELSLADLHALERLCSYVRHSIVRACFYNLKLFCPSLVDEYDPEVKAQVLLNIDQLPLAREEIEQFYAQVLSGGKPIGELFPEARAATFESFDELAQLAAATHDVLDDEPRRTGFATRAPALIDAVMESLQSIQSDLDRRRISIADTVDLAVNITRAMAEQAGLTVHLCVQPTPGIFGDRRRLANAFAELVANAAKYSQGSRLDVSVDIAGAGKQDVRVCMADDGRGMTETDLATCLERGVSSQGTGEGLPMVVQVVEEEHLGRFEIESAPGQGCRALVSLPVKLTIKKGQP